MYLAILLDQPQAPGNPLLQVGVPGRVVIQTERRPHEQVIEKKEDGVGIARQPDLRRGDMRKDGERQAVVVPTKRISEQAEKRHRPLPTIARDVGHVH